VRGRRRPRRPTGAAGAEAGHLLATTPAVAAPSPPPLVSPPPCRPRPPPPHRRRRAPTTRRRAWRPAPHPHTLPLVTDASPAPAPARRRGGWRWLVRGWSPPLAVLPTGGRLAARGGRSRGGGGRERGAACRPCACWQRRHCLHRRRSRWRDRARTPQSGSRRWRLPLVPCNLVVYRTSSIARAVVGAIAVAAAAAVAAARSRRGAESPRRMRQRCVAGKPRRRQGGGRGWESELLRPIRARPLLCWRRLGVRGGASPRILDAGSPAWPSRSLPSRHRFLPRPFQEWQPIWGGGSCVAAGVTSAVAAAAVAFSVLTSNDNSSGLPDAISTMVIAVAASEPAVVAAMASAAAAAAATALATPKRSVMPDGERGGLVAGEEGLPPNYSSNT